MSFSELDYPQLLEALSQHAASLRAKNACRGLKAQSSADKASTLATQVVQAEPIVRETRFYDLTVLDSIGPILDRLSVKAVLDAKELMAVRLFLNQATYVKSSLRGTRNTWTETMATALADFKSQLSAIDHVIDHAGEINETASALLASLFEEQRRLSREVSRTLDQLVKKHSMESILQDRYVTTREGRLVVPVKSGAQHDLKGLIIDSSQSKQTVFMEPEAIVPMNNRLRELHIQIQDEIYRILQELSQYLGKSLTSFRNADATLFECDVNFAKAQLNLKLKGSVAHFSEKDFSLKDLRHPLLQLQGVNVVPNSVSLNQNQRVLLLSGPNAGGKTILLKSIGLAAQMARSGLPLPASEGSVLPFFEHLDPIVGDLQSVGQNLSSFSSHISRLTQTLKYKSPHTLILVDEICGATDPEEGSALARSVIEHFCDAGVYAVVTSHLGPLKENWSKESGVVHGSLEFDTKSNHPTYQLLMGLPGRSLALSVAQQLGFPKELIQKARNYLSPDSKKRSETLEDIEQFKAQIIEMKAQVAKDREEAQSLKNQYFELVRKFREQRDKWLEKALEKANKKIENLIEDARQDRIKNRTLHDIKADLPEIVKPRLGALKPQTLEDFKNQFKPGTPAYSSRLARMVLIQSEPDNKGQVSVLADSMRVQLPWHTLTANPDTPQEAKPQTVRRSGASSATALDENEVELDLRGQRVDDAIILLEKWLDDCLRNQTDKAKVIHGFGTEQLKKAVRQFLSKSRYVTKWTAGDHNSGGDGITWVYL